MRSWMCLLKKISPYGKLVQKGHARMFYNVSRWCSLCKSEQRVDTSRTIFETLLHRDSLLYPRPSDLSTRPRPIPTRPWKRRSWASPQTITNLPLPPLPTVSNVAETCTLRHCTGPWQVWWRRRLKVWRWGNELECTRSDRDVPRVSTCCG